MPGREVIERGAPPRREWRIPHSSALIVATCVLLVLLWSLLIEWEWSFVDDAGQKTALRQAIHESGLFGGVLNHVEDQARADWNDWGLFRPAWYLYAGLFYLTNPLIAHALRFGMLLAAIVIPAIRLTKDEDGRSQLPAAIWAICVFAANTTLYQGVTFLSLQELTGLALVAVGLTMSNRLVRTILWLLAAWMKTPFVWLFLAWGVYLLAVRRTRTLGVAVVAVAAGTVVAAAVNARAGTYSSEFDLSVSKAIASLRTALPLFAWPGLIGVLGLVALRPQLRTIAWRDPLALVLTSGGLLYLANLLPWGRIDVYYGSPAIWMLSAAAVRLIATAESRPHTSVWRAVSIAVLVATVAVGAYISSKMLRLQYNRNDAVVTARNFALEVREPSPVIGINGSEAAVRLQQIIALHQPDWAGRIVFIDPADASAAPDYYIKLSDEEGVNPQLTHSPLRERPAVTIYQR